MRKLVTFVLLTALGLSATLAAQSGRLSRGGRTPFHFGFSHGPGFGRGVFPGIFPGFHDPRIAFFGHPFLLGIPHTVIHPSFSFGGFHLGGQGLAEPNGFHFRAGPFSNGFAFGQPGVFVSAPYGGWSFVEAWKDRAPPPGASGNSLSDSLLLSEGMNEEEVMRVLGSPLKRIQLGQKKVWQYSGYALLFENGALTEIR